MARRRRVTLEAIEAREKRAYLYRESIERPLGTLKPHLRVDRSVWFCWYLDRPMGCGLNPHEAFASMEAHYERNILDL